MYVHKMDGRDPLIAIEPPVRLRTRWEKINHRPGGLLPVQMHILRLSVLVIVLASVVGIRNCGQLPLVADVSWLEVVGFTSKAISHTAPHLVDSTDLYYSVAQMMVGGINKFGTEEMATGESSFMISEHGWTLFLSSVGAADPALAVPEQLFLRKGVPTKESTNERSYRVRDADANTEVHEENPMMPCRKILDRGNMYVPRCVEHVVERVEYYATTRNDFRLDIQHSIEASEIARRFAISRSLRSFHDGLWNSIMAPSCSHEEKEYDLKPVELPPGVAAGTALDWDEDAAPDRGEPEMVCIALTKNDPNIRWLSVAMSERKVMIRGPSTCVICAVSSAASLPGKWLVLI